MEYSRVSGPRHGLLTSGLFARPYDWFYDCFDHCFTEFDHCLPEFDHCLPEFDLCFTELWTCFTELWDPVTTRLTNTPGTLNMPSF